MSNRTYVYVDGFNLYYGAVRGTAFRWLDLDKMCALLLPKHDIRKITYCTAIVSGRPDDPDKPLRQHRYLRALRTIPHLEIVEGYFLSQKTHMPLADCQPGQQQFAKVIKTEEKGSDVNIGARLVHEAHCGLFDTAVIVSGDSDLLEPIRIVRHDLGKPVGIITPRRRLTRVLQKEASFIRAVRKGVLKDSQFPNPLSDAKGEFHKPSEW